MASNANIEDITDEFFASCKELNLGEIVKYDLFNLFDAISAIEILDPKMDLGMQPLDDKLTLKEAVKNGKVNVTDVPLNDMISLIDATMALIMCWLEGQSLDQTVYTNICLLDLDTIKDPILFGFCMGALNFIQGTKLCIELAGVFNEEDYSSYTSHFKLNFPFKLLCVELDTAIEILRDRKSNKGELKLLNAIEARLCFLQTSFKLFSFLFLTAEQTVPQFKKAIILLDQILSYINQISDTLLLGTQPLVNENDSNYSWLPYFEPHANRLLLPPSFPRETKILDRKSALKKYENFFITTKRMLNQLPEAARDLECLLLFLQNFGGFGSSLLSRSLAQLLVMPNDFVICGLYSLNTIVEESVRELDSCLCGSNTELTLFPNSTVSDDIQEFLILTTKAFISVFQIFGHNVARQRDNLLKNCFYDFGLLQSMAYQIESDWSINRLNDTEQSTVLTTFLLLHISKLMLYHLELGFNLELFVPYEFPYVYFYYGKIVATKLAAFLERKCSLLVLNFSRSIATMNIKKINKKNQIKQRAEIKLKKDINQLQSTIFLLKIDTFISNAFIKFSMGLKFSNRLKVPEGESFRYNQRFDVYSSLSDILYANYDFFAKTPEIKNLKNASPEQYFSEASIHFEEAVDFFKSLESQNTGIVTSSMKSLMKVAKQNSIVSKLLASSSNLNKKVVFETAQCDRPIFPLIKLV